MARRGYLNQEEENAIERLYLSYGGNFSLEDFKKFRNYFNIACSKCQSDQIAIMTKTDDDGYCETCSSPYAVVTIKCKNCGNAVSIRN